MILMNKYRSAMGKITVSPEMEERILRNLSNEKCMDAEIKKKSNFKWIKPVSTIAACCTIVITSMFIHSSLVKNDSKVQQNRAPQFANNTNKTKSQPIKLKPKSTNIADNSRKSKMQQIKRQSNSSRTIDNFAVAKVQQQRNASKDVKIADNSRNTKGQQIRKESIAARTDVNLGAARVHQNKWQTKTTGITDGITNRIADNAVINKVKQREDQSKVNTVADNHKITETQQNKEQPPKNNEIDNPKTDKAPQTTKQNQQDTQHNGETAISSPFLEIKDLNELKKAVTFKLLVPDTPPTGYKIENISLISGEMVQIIYSNGNDKIVYRTEGGTNDTSGDYTTYDQSEVVKIGDTDVTLKGNKSLVNLAIWSQNNCSYSLSFSCAVEKDVVMSIINNIKEI